MVYAECSTSCWTRHSWPPLWIFNSQQTKCDKKLHFKLWTGKLVVCTLFQMVNCSWVLFCVHDLLVHEGVFWILPQSKNIFHIWNQCESLCWTANCPECNFASSYSSNDLLEEPTQAGMERRAWMLWPLWNPTRATILDFYFIILIFHSQGPWKRYFTSSTIHCMKESENKASILFYYSESLKIKVKNMEKSKHVKHVFGQIWIIDHFSVVLHPSGTCSGSFLGG